jgi:hypothetical protein
MTTPKSNRSLRLKSAALAATLVVGITSLLHSAPADASGVPVVDGAHIALQKFEFGQEILRFTDQVAHWNKQITEWKNLLSQNPLQRVGENASARPKIGQNLQMRSDDFGLEETCGSSGSGNPLASISNVFHISFNPEGNPVEEQKKLCTLSVVLQNRKWNENVLMIRQMELLQEKLDAVADARTSGMTQGEIDTNFGDMTVAESDFNTNRAKGEARINTYENMLASVSHMQSVAGKMMLSGTKPNGFFGAAATTLVQGAILQGALSIDAGDCGGKLGETCSN